MQLADYLERHGLTATAFAKRIGVSNSLLSYIIAGKRDPGPGTMRAIFEATNGEVTPNDLLIAATGDTPEGGAEAAAA